MTGRVRRGAAVLGAAVLVAASAAVGAASPAQAAPADAVWGEDNWAYIIGTDYSARYLQGAVLVRYDKTPGCTPSAYDTDSTGNVVPLGWNDEIESFDNYGYTGPGYVYCVTVHYEHGYLGGSFYPHSQYSDDMGSFRNKTSSARFT
jgi:hypothetical protein